MGNMRNIIRLKDIPSNTIEEAIIIFKDNKKAKKYEYTNKFKKENNNDRYNENYVIKEAELIISDYLKNSENDDSSIKSKIKKLKFINTVLVLLLIVSIIF